MMINKYLILFSFLLGFTQTNIEAATSIKGHIHLDSTWARTAYLSLIPNLNEMNTMSYNIIIGETAIDSSGHFSFDTRYLPEQDKLYRIHISKKGDPPTSIFIGGKEENHFFIIANHHSIVIIRDTSRRNFLKDVVVTGYPPNRQLGQINEMAGYADTLRGGSALKKEFIKNAVYEKLRAYADTCTHPIVSLYALYKSKFESNYAENRQFYKDYLDEWQFERSSYFKAFRDTLPMKQSHEWLTRAAIGMAFFFLGVMVTHWMRRRRKKHQNPMNHLTVQERKVFALLREGKSNKEISEEFNIGLSTVKSHANNIYSKLKVKSRKELMNLKN